MIRVELMKLIVVFRERDLKIPQIAGKKLFDLKLEAV